MTKLGPGDIIYLVVANAVVLAFIIVMVSEPERAKLIRCLSWQIANSKKPLLSVAVQLGPCHCAE
jgi:hypothetical protein